MGIALHKGSGQCPKEEPHPSRDCYLRELPVQLHPLGLGVAALDEPGPAVDVHQTAVVVVIYSGAQDPHVDLLAACVVHILGVREEEKGQRTVAREMEVKWPLSPDNWQTVLGKGRPRFLHPVTFRCTTRTMDSQKPFQFVNQERIWSTCNKETKLSRNETCPHCTAHSDIFYSILALKKHWP